MKIITTKAELQELTLSLKQQKTIGFVPTMGYLHEGHRALLKEARRENDILILSVFVNPLQFGPNEDLESYPRDIEQDKLTAKNEGVDYLFMPSTEEMYPSTPSVTVHVQKRADVLCGRTRPGHFDGVATVLTKLFHLVQPDNVYFGKKDAQQVAVVDGLIQDFHFPITLHAVQTVREEDGLAKSSRNVKLSHNERQEAGILYQTLSMAREELIKGNHDARAITDSLSKRIETNTSGKVDYLEILTYPELQEPSHWEGSLIIAVAVRFNNARLIDNIIFDINEMAIGKGASTCSEQ